VLALGFIVSPRALARPPRGTVHEARANVGVPPQATRNIVKSEQFVNRLLREEDQIIARNTRALSTRDALARQLDYLESLTPQNRSQARSLSLLYLRDTRLLVQTQYVLNQSMVHITTFVPGIDAAITGQLNRLGVFTPYIPQVSNFVAFASARQQANNAAFESILSQIPPSP
jgi:hypothetical protein